MWTHSDVWILDYLLLWGVNKAPSAKRCELCERTALCNASKRSAPQAHEEKQEKIWHIAKELSGTLDL